MNKFLFVLLGVVAVAAAVVIGEANAEPTIFQGATMIQAYFAPVIMSIVLLIFVIRHNVSFGHVAALGILAILLGVTASLPAIIALGEKGAVFAAVWANPVFWIVVLVFLGLAAVIKYRRELRAES
jgi:hypothetical protein